MHFKSLHYCLAVYTAAVLGVMANANIFDAARGFGLNKLEAVAKQHMKHDFNLNWGNVRSAVKLMSIGEQFSSGEKEQKWRPSQGLKGPFKWDSCGPAGQLVDIRNLTVKPSPLTFPGTLSFGFDIVFHDNIEQSAKLAASLNLQYRRQGGSTWVKIPCLGLIGSCDYTDLCTLTQGIQCPDELKQKGIPCTCPFNKGEYKLPLYSIEIDASVFPPGDYKAKAVLNDAARGQIGCYDIMFSAA